MNLRTLPLFCAALWLFSCQKAPQSLDQISLDSGIISGTRTADGAVLSFKGIPYAQPPVGELRWKAPQPVTPWTDVKACTAFGASPVQPKPVPFAVYTPEYLIPDSPRTENCLTLNVWTPAKSAEEKLPVLVWIYGGGFSSGGTAVPIYDGEALARKGIIVVSINYRVGVLGFFSHPWLTAESPDHASGNYGLLDQIAGLQWIQRNIAAFGGDPAKVTIAGQSAGSMSVNALVASPVAKGLFRGAIGESGGARTMQSIPLSDAETRGQQLTEALGVNSLEALRALPADTLLARGSGMGVIVDGFVLPQSISDLMAAGKHNDVSMMLGWNADEGFMWQTFDARGWKQKLETEYADDAKALLTAYPAPNDSVALLSQRAFSTHLMFGLPIYLWAKAQVQHGKSPVFVYQFAHTPPGPEELRKAGAHHTAEVPYVFSTLPFLNRPWEPVDYALADAMSDRWVQFVKEDNPNHSAMTNWPPFASANPEALRFGTEGSAVKAERVPMPDLGKMQVLEAALAKKP